MELFYMCYMELAPVLFSLGPRGIAARGQGEELRDGVLESVACFLLNIAAYRHAARQCEGLLEGVLHAVEPSGSRL